jgi:xanthine/CO dehydrogenase XdhC/CoxF family maturation factor
VKHWQESTRIFDRIAALADAGEPAVLATVVRIAGSSYRRPGAKLLIEPNGHTLGGVSGGCLEADVRENALTALRDGRPRLLAYETGGDEQTVWGLGLGCNGSIEVFVQPLGDVTAGAVRAIRDALRGDRAFAIASTVAPPEHAGAIVVAGEDGTIAVGDPALGRTARAAAARGLAAAAPTLDEQGGIRVFVDVLAPPPWVLVCGAGDDAIPVARFAAHVGFRVAVADHRPSYLTRERFPDAARLHAGRADAPCDDLPAGADTFAVVMNHSLLHDREWSRRLLARHTRYVGLLGPRDRTDQIVEAIGGAHDQVFGPVGLDLGADGPEQVALSVVAELLAVHGGRSPGHLRDRASAIHA